MFNIIQSVSQPDLYNVIQGDVSPAGYPLGCFETLAHHLELGKAHRLLSLLNGSAVTLDPEGGAEDLILSDAYDTIWIKTRTSLLSISHEDLSVFDGHHTANDPIVTIRLDRSGDVD